MRKYDVAYVPNVSSHPYPVKPLQEMTVDEIVKKYLTMCAKSNGKVSVCSKCPTPCAEGKRAIQLLANEVYDDPPIPLYGGKTLIEKAREENMLRRQKAEEEKKEKEKMEETKEVKTDKWYEDAMASGDPKKYIAELFGISGVKAAKKLYQYRYSHNLTDKTKMTKLGERAKPSATVAETKAVKVETPVVKTMDASVTDTIEAKMEALLKLQEKHKKIMLDMQEQYEKAKQNYEDIKKKVDILCSAMDIINE